MAAAKLPWLARIAPGPRLVGDQRVDGGWIEPLRVIYDHELVLFRGGPFVVEIDGQALRCAENSFVIIPPGRAHLSRLASRASGHRHWIHFDWLPMSEDGDTPVLTYLPGQPRAERYRPAPGWLPRGLLHGPIAAPRRCFDLYHRVERLATSALRRDRLLARARLLELLIDVLADPEDAASAPQPLREPVQRVREVLDRIAVRPVAEAPSIQDELAALGHSYAHLARRFRATYGLSPLQYVNAVRIERSKLLIRDSELPLAAIAERVGFASPAYFARQFRKQTGRAASELLREWRGNRDAARFVSGAGWARTR